MAAYLKAPISAYSDTGLTANETELALI